MNAVSKILKYCNAGEEMWEQIATKDKTTVYKHKDKDFCYKVESVLDNTPATVMAEIYKIKKRPKWDTDLEKTYIVEKISPFNMIYYIQTKPISICSARDFVTHNIIEKIENGYIVATSGTEHPNEPERSGIIRGKVKIGGQVIYKNPRSPNKSCITEIIDADIKGLIPSLVIKLFTGKKCFEKMEALNNWVKDLPRLDEWTV